MDGSRIRKEKVADSKISGYVWTGTELLVNLTFADVCACLSVSLTKFRAFLIQESVHAFLLVLEILFIHLFVNVFSKLQETRKHCNFVDHTKPLQTND